MIPIKNSADFRRGYEWLRLLSDAHAANGFGKPEVAREEIANVKRELRAYANCPAAVDVGMGFMCERRIVKDYGIDGYIELVSIPDVFDTLTDKDGEPGAESFFMTFLYRGSRPSMYDCTGQAFTSWYKIFHRRGQFWAYHRVSIDV